MSYGASQTDGMRQVGVYGRPDTQGREARRSAGRAATKFEFVINLQTAKALGSTCRQRCSARRRGDRVKRREFITLLGCGGGMAARAGAQTGGSETGRSLCWCPLEAASTAPTQRFAKHLRNWVGPMVRTLESIIVWRRRPRRANFDGLRCGTHSECDPGARVQ